MVFCKLSKKVKNKLENTEKEYQSIQAQTKKKITNLDKKIKNKLKEASKKQDDILNKAYIARSKIIGPYKASKSKNRAVMFIIDVFIFIALGLFLYKSYPHIKKFILKKVSYTEQQYKEAMNLPESAFSREELRKIAVMRKSFQDWLDYYKADSAFSDFNVGRGEIAKGNLLRGPFIFMIQYVIPYVIVAYMVWFVIKYVKYVIAAMWGFFIAIYQFTTRKITCTLAEKWYIRLITGWNTCSPRFADYLNSWQNNYVYRPIAEQRINYLKNLTAVRRQYDVSLKDLSPVDFGKRVFDNLFSWFSNLKRIYIDLPLNELYLRLIDFHRDFVVRPYSLLGEDMDKKSKKAKGEKYPSKTKSGKVCVCPPRKTSYSKLKALVKDSSKIVAKTEGSIEKTLDKGFGSTKKNLEITKDKVENAIKKPAKILSDCNTYDSVLENKKIIARIIWVILFLIVGIIATYSLFIGYPRWLKNYLAPIYVYTSQIPKVYLQGATITFGITYLIVFGILGYYSIK
jgi:hypothetical protein